MTRPAFLPAALLPVFVSFVSFVVQSTHGETLATQLRRPVALAPSPDGKWLYVANRDSGTISVVDLASRTVAVEHKVGQRLSDLAFIPNSSRLLATDEAAHELLLLETRETQIEILHRLPISPYPVSLLINADGQSATIASLWSCRLTFASLPLPARGDGRGEGRPPEARMDHVLDLPFAPRAQLLLPNRQRLLVADAFGGRLALIDTRTREIAESREIPAHNIRGLGASPCGQMLVVSHQMLNDLAQSVRNDIHWGLLMTNDLRWLKVDSLLAGGEELYRGGHMHPLGDPGKGGADPGAIDVAADGTVVVTISGVNQVAFGKEGDFSMQRLKVGRRPTAIKLAPPRLGEGRGEGNTANSQVAYIANTFDDSISVLDLSRRAITATISLGPAPELSLAQRGELLFYDARLSHDGWMSCHSCHTDGHSNGQMNDNFSDRSFGAAKRVISLLGVKDTLPLAWNGQVPTLEQQIQNSVKSTMQRENALASEDVRSLVAYLNTLEPPPALDTLREAGLRPAKNSDSSRGAGLWPANDSLTRGRAIFDRLECATCHAPPTYTSPKIYDVGLRDAQGTKEFNPPSLRGLSQRGPYFHDNSAASLADVFTTHGHPPNSPVPVADLNDLLAFLRSL